MGGWVSGKWHTETSKGWVIDKKKKRDTKREKKGYSKHETADRKNRGSSAMFMS